MGGKCHAIERLRSFFYYYSMQIYSDKLFENPVEIVAGKPSKEKFKRLEELQARGLHILGYVTYDFEEMYFESYVEVKKFVPKQVEGLGIITEPLISKEEYLEKVQYIKAQILEGITYEVNYTYPSVVKTNADEISLYNYLLEKQKTPYNAFLKNDKRTILSFSPELFFRLKGRKIFTKPMKGTAPRGENSIEDEKNREFLKNDIKNRAENIMIVDLLRNDLGRIAKTGSVKVDKLFEVEEHPTLFQMTSEISAELDEGVGLYEIFKSIFPCGSITGAPKLSTMRVIEDTEPYAREVYCGAIGYIHGDEAVFSVPIRILQKKNTEKYFRYHVGGAIVWDSEPLDEWEETITKTKFLQTDFSLIEKAVGGWSAHVNRMKKSANELDFVWNKDIESLIIPEGKALRIKLHKNGSFEKEYQTVSEIKSRKIRIKGTVDSSNPFLYHKTTIREESPKDVFDEIRVNERGEITEGTYTNVGILKNGKYYTPPISSGLLVGTYRAKLGWEEKVLYPEDLKCADKIFCFNSVRGLVEVELC